MGHTDYGPLTHCLKTADKDDTDVFFLEVRGDKEVLLSAVLGNSLDPAGTGYITQTGSSF